MLARLGNVFYWAACIVAVLIVVFIAVVGVFNKEMDAQTKLWATLAVVVLALLCWLAGRAMRYVLAGVW